MKAVILGATGAVGKELLKNILLEPRYSEIYVLGRKSILNISNKGDFIPIVIDFENIKFDLEILNNADVYCALGTTIKVAKTKENQFKVDYTYIINVAKLCENRVNSFNIVSSIGANSNSSNFYLNTKGLLEESLKKLRINYLRIFQPSLLIAKRNDNRILESFGMKILPVLSNLFFGKFINYKPIKVENLAKTMIYYTLKNDTKIYYTYEDFIKE
ncbi:epimerase [Gemelliphila palaticanis]|nr:epimerase [Gemella palaticanis]